MAFDSENMEMVLKHAIDDKRTYQELYQEVQEGCICVGSAGFFRVDYTFSCQVMVLVVTFFIISSQYSH